MTSVKLNAKRCCAQALSLVVLIALALSVHAASTSPVGIKLWKEKSDKESAANDAVDTDREATLTRLANGTYTLVLPVKQISKVGMTGYMTGLTIGDITYDGELTGDVTNGTGVLTIKNLPASVMTGGDVNNALLVTCNMQMELLGSIGTTVRMCIWAE